MKKQMIITLILMVFLTLGINSGYAKVKIDGTIKAEAINDPLSGSRFPSGFKMYEIMKMSLGINITERRVEAFMPLTIDMSNLRINLVADDFITIPYYLLMRANPFVYSISCSPIGDKKVGFESFGDPLGVFKKPNSQQPILTFKMTSNKPRGWHSALYLLFDQKVEGIPIWEKIPNGNGEAGDYLLGEHKLSDYGFIDEVAQYNLLQVSRELDNGLEVGFIFGQKYVDNPMFRLESSENEPSDTFELSKWGFKKENVGFTVDGTILSKVNVKGESIFGSGSWCEYKSTVSTIDKGNLSGFAALLSMSTEINEQPLECTFISVDPTFQAVAANHGQFPVISRLVPDSATKPTRYFRNSRAIFDPTGDLTGKMLQSSHVVDYLGKRALFFGTEKESVLRSMPVLFGFDYGLVKGIEGLSTLYQHPKNKANVVKDYKEISTFMQIGPYKISGIDRDYLADPDYRRVLAAFYSKRFDSSILSAGLEYVWRLRNDDLYGKGGAQKATVNLSSSKNMNLKYSVGIDFRNGNYDYDLLRENNDRVVDQYRFLGIYTYFEKGKSFLARNKREGLISLAGEAVCSKTNLSGAKSGVSLVGFADLKYPISDNLISKSLLIGVSGPQEVKFPSGHLKTTFSQEFQYNVDDNETICTLGLSLRPNISAVSKNFYAELISKVGQGNFRLTYGHGTLPSFSENEPFFDGALTLNDVYGVGYPPASVLRDRPWEAWDNDNLYALRGKLVYSTENTWTNYIALRYWVDF